MMELFTNASKEDILIGPSRTRPAKPHIKRGRSSREALGMNGPQSQSLAPFERTCRGIRRESV